jgi:hypothetical protein
VFPKALGVLLVVGGTCYLVDLLAVFLVPAIGNEIIGFITIPSAIAEISMDVYLLVIGVKTTRRADHAEPRSEIAYSGVP